MYAIAAGTGKRDAKGAWVPLDTRALSTVAARTGGGFFEARDAASVRRVYADIDRLAKAPLEAPTAVVEDRFLGFLLAGVALLFVARLLQATLWDVLP